MNDRVTDRPDQLDRATGALVGLALGDALGMPTQLLSYAEVHRRYGLLDGFHPGPDDHPIAAGMPAGRVTDDTDQAVIIGRLLVEGGGRVDPAALVRDLLAWQQVMITAGSQDLLGPSTTRALQAITDGVEPAVAGRSGDTNGAAMRITPVGIAYAPEPLAALLDAVVATSEPTHGTGLAIAGAAAVAAAVSVGVEGGTVADAVDLAVVAAAEGASRGVHVPGADVATRIRWAVDTTRGRTDAELLGRVDALVGTSLATQESVPAAFAVISSAGDDPWLAVRLAASLGGDSDTIAAMTGAVVGAVHGASAFPPEQVERLEAVNPTLDLATLARALSALRR